MLAKFHCIAKLADYELPIDVIVSKGNAPAILSHETSIKFGVLKMGMEINLIGNSEIQTLFDDCCKGVGKLKNFQLQLHVDENVKPVVQPLRRLPFALIDKEAQKPTELEDDGIIERVEGPTTWVSPLVVIPKNNDTDIRICVDMRQANKPL